MSDRDTVILARVSSKAQEDEGYSLDSQLKLLESYCDNKSLIVKRVFRIAETASKEQSRRIFHELLSYIKKEKICHLAVEKTDRLTRNLRDAVAIDDWLNDDGRRMLHAVKENLVVHKEARSDVKFMWSIHLAVAKKFTDNLREEAMKGWTEKLAQGWMPAPPPPGYMTVIENGKRIHVPNPETARIITASFEKYLEPGQTLNGIAEYLEQRGITSRKGRPLSKSAVHKNMQNPFYIGLISFNGRIYDGAQTPLLDKKLFDAVLAKIRGKRPAKNRIHVTPLKGIATCAYCKRVLSWQLQKGHYYGACQRSLALCKKRKYIRLDLVEDVILEHFDKLISPSHAVVDWLVDELTDSKRGIEFDMQQQELSLNERLKKFKMMDETLYEDKLAGEITRERYNDKHQSFIAEIKEIESQIKSLSTDMEEEIEKRITVLQLTQRAKEEYVAGDSERRREIINDLIESIEIDVHFIRIKVTEFVAMIADSSLQSRELIKSLKGATA